MILFKMKESVCVSTDCTGNQKKCNYDKEAVLVSRSQHLRHCQLLAGDGQIEYIRPRSTVHTYQTRGPYARLSGLREGPELREPTVRQLISRCHDFEGNFQGDPEGGRSNGEGEGGGQGDHKHTQVWGSGVGDADAALYIFAPSSTQESGERVSYISLHVYKLNI